MKALARSTATSSGGNSRSPLVVPSRSNPIRVTRAEWEARYISTEDCSLRHTNHSLEALAGASTPSRAANRVASSSVQLGLIVRYSGNAAGMVGIWRGLINIGTFPFRSSRARSEWCSEDWACSVCRHH